MARNNLGKQAKRPMDKNLGEQAKRPMDKNSGEQAKRPMDKNSGEQAKRPMDKNLGEQAKRPMDKKSSPMLGARVTLGSADLACWNARTFVLPSSIAVRNYRCFATEQRLVLRPLTLLFGHNNAGKSAFARLLPLLADSLSYRGLGALDSSSPALRGAAIDKLPWAGGDRRDRDDDLHFELSWAEGSRTFAFSIRYEREWPRVFVRELRLEAEGQAELHLRHNGRRPESSARSLDYVELETGQSGSVEYSGLCPRQATSPDWQQMIALFGEELDAFGRGVLWLGANRRGPAYFEPAPSEPHLRLGERASELVQVLATQPSVLLRVSNWLESNAQRELLLASEANGVRTLVRPLDEGPQVDLRDCGEGLTQLIPVLCAFELAREQKELMVLVIEEPENHLHAAMQRDLGMSMASYCQPGKAIVLETHSEQLLLGVRLAVARGELRPLDVAVHWLRPNEDGSSELELVELDDLANWKDPWPPRVWGHSLDLARELLEAQRLRAEST